MATATPFPISINEYLHTSYQPDCDYVDGLVEERNLGELDHSETQRELVTHINRRQRQGGVHALPEIRVRTSASHVRIADIAIISVAAPREQVIQTPPVAVIEILSPQDRIPSYSTRFWVVDPAIRKGFDCSTEEWIETASFAVPDTPIRIDLAALFAATDQDRAR